MTGCVPKIRQRRAGDSPVSGADLESRSHRTTSPWLNTQVLGRIGIVAAGLFPWVMVDGVPTGTPAHAVAAIITFAAMGSDG